MNSEGYDNLLNHTPHCGPTVATASLALMPDRMPFYGLFSNLKHVGPGHIRREHKMLAVKTSVSRKSRRPSAHQIPIARWIAATSWNIVAVSFLVLC